jgi:hypothetical protein
MRHFAKEEWIDFVNQTVTAEKQTEMQRHLTDGCAPCATAAGLWQRVRKAAAAERKYQPPAGAIRMVKAAFVTSGLAASAGKARRAFEKLFDSFRQPALAGARSSGSRVRQVLYRAEPYQVDVQIENTPHGNSMVVTGQLLDVTHAETVGREIPVVLSNGHGGIVRTVTNEFGEFGGVLEDSGDLELSFVGQGHKPMVISLRDALGRKSRGAR